MCPNWRHSFNRFERRSYSIAYMVEYQHQAFRTPLLLTLRNSIDLSRHSRYMHVSSHVDDMINAIRCTIKNNEKQYSRVTYCVSFKKIFAISSLLANFCDLFPFWALKTPKKMFYVWFQKSHIFNVSKLKNENFTGFVF